MARWVTACHATSLRAPSKKKSLTRYALPPAQGGAYVAGYWSPIEDCKETFNIENGSNEKAVPAARSATSLSAAKADGTTPADPPRPRTTPPGKPGGMVPVAC